MIMKKQVDKSHYDFIKYVSKSRWNSYYHQIEEVISSNPNTVLVVGIGDGIVIDILRNSIKNCIVDTIDIDPQLNPTYVGSITEVDELLNVKKYDVILCSQVLEHIPFDMLEKIISKFTKVNNKKLIISLPEQNIKVGLSIKIPKLFLNAYLYIPRFYKEHKFDGEHYWELGTKQTRLNSVRDIFKEYYKISNEYVVNENSYHRFFILDK